MREIHVEPSIDALEKRERVCVVWEGSEPLPHHRDGPLTRYVLDRFHPVASHGTTEIWMPPSAWYTDRSIYELERGAVFHASWQPVA